MKQILHTFLHTSVIAKAPMLHQFLQRGPSIFDSIPLADPFPENTLGQLLYMSLCELPARPKAEIRRLEELIKTDKVQEFLDRAHELATGLSRLDTHEAHLTVFGKWTWFQVELPETPTQWMATVETNDHGPSVSLWEDIGAANQHAATLAMENLWDDDAGESAEAAQLRFMARLDAQGQIVSADGYRIDVVPVDLQAGEKLRDAKTIRVFNAALKTITGIDGEEAGLGDEDILDWMEGFDTAFEAAEAYREKYGLVDIRED